MFLGTNHGHGAAAALLGESGELLFAVEEGRLLGAKEYSGFPERALSEISNRYDGTIAAWSEGWHGTERLIRKGLATSVRFAWRDPTYVRERLLRECRRFVSGALGIARWSGRFGPVRYVGHHDAHALSLLPWGLPKDSVILVSDYVGERWSLSSFHWGADGLRPLDRVPFPHSLGAAYQQLATHFGLFGSVGPGKVMALAAYGEPRWTPLLQGLVGWRSGSLRIDQRLFPLWRRRRAWSSLAESIGGDFRAQVRASRGNWAHGHDLAASVQDWLSQTTLRYLSNCVQKARSDLSLRVTAVGLAGGCALNCQANGSLIKRCAELGIEQVVISPWPDDSGTAIGGAVHAALHHLSGEIEFQPSSAFLGPGSNESVEVTTDGLEKTATTLVEGGIVAVAVGRLEFGPRALGGRCLLADPRRPDAKERLNTMKGRPSYMPLAPAVLAEHQARYFHDAGSTNMAWTVRMRSKARTYLPGMDHASGEARVQVVGPDGPPVLRRLLCEWERLTGCGALLLTSLNGAREPIPDTVERSIAVARRLGARGIVLDVGWLPLED